MTLSDTAKRNAVSRHVGPEDFRTYAHQELVTHTPWQWGVCFLPECGATFTPRRDWQMYCCTACERAGTNEFRRWGHKMALSSLVHRLGKYETKNEGVRNLTRAARRHVTAVQSAWLDERRTRAARGRNHD